MVVSSSTSFVFFSSFIGSILQYFQVIAVWQEAPGIKRRHLSGWPKAVVWLLFLAEAAESAAAVSAAAAAQKQ